MTYDLSISSEKKLVQITLQGPYSVLLLNNLIERVIRNKGYQKSFNFLVDFRNVEFSPEADDLSVLSELIFDNAAEFPVKLARIIHDESIKSFFEQLSSIEVEKGYSSKIFKDLDEAFNWLQN